MFTEDYYLAISICITVLQVLSFIGNGFIIFLFLKNNRLRTCTGLRLIFILACVDCIFPILIIPQILYFIIEWGPDHIDYNGIFVVTSGIPLTIAFKVNLLLIIGIALDRIQAICYPIYYRQKNQPIYTHIILFIGLALASIDIVLMYTLKIEVHEPNCAASGCFLSHKFKTYWGLGNMVLSGIGVVLTVIFAHKLKKLIRKKENLKNGSNSNDEQQLQQANLLSICIMIISVLFLMVPSILICITSMLGHHIFKNLGSFYTLFLLLTGFINSLIYVTLHAELKKAAKSFFGRKNAMVGVLASVPQTT